jgi:hypothetical protein
MDGANGVIGTRTFRDITEGNNGAYQAAIGWRPWRR